MARTRKDPLRSGVSKDSGPPSTRGYDDISNVVAEPQIKARRPAGKARVP